MPRFFSVIGATIHHGLYLNEHRLVITDDPSCLSTPGSDIMVVLEESETGGRGHKVVWNGREWKRWAIGDSHHIPTEPYSILGLTLLEDKY